MPGNPALWMDLRVGRPELGRGAGRKLKPRVTHLFGRGCSSMVERQLPKLHTRVRFPSPAPTFHPNRSRMRHRWPGRSPKLAAFVAQISPLDRFARLRRSRRTPSPAPAFARNKNVRAAPPARPSTPLGRRRFGPPNCCLLGYLAIAFPACLNCRISGFGRGLSRWRLA